MRWIVVVNGSHWLQVSDVIFTEHHKNKDWCFTMCDNFSAVGSMVELSRGETSLLIPHGSVVAAFFVRDLKKPMGFFDPNMLKDDGEP